MFRRQLPVTSSSSCLGVSLLISGKSFFSSSSSSTINKNKNNDTVISSSLFSTTSTTFNNNKTSLCSIAAVPILKISNRFTSSTTTMTSSNPLLEPSTLPYQYPPFDKIKNEHYAPAFEIAMKEHQEEIKAIIDNKDEPTFENTVLALENAGQKLNRVNTIFSALNHADTNDELQKLDVEISPKLSAHNDSIFLNEDLFKRIKVLYDKRDELAKTLPDKESARLLWRYHLDFVRAGAAVTDLAAKETLKTLNTELATLETKMQQSILAEVADSAVWFDDEKELDGFSADELEGARKAAEAVEEGKRKGKFLVKLRNTTPQPVFVSLNNPDTRKKILAASLARGSRGGPNDVRETICKIAKLRAQRAQLLGFPDHATFQLSDEMTKTPQRAIDLLRRVAKPAMENAMKEAEELKKFSGLGEKFCAADWDHWAEKLRAEKYSFDENMLKPYFEVDSIYKNSVFHAAKIMYGLDFVERNDLPVYHPTVKTYDVKEEGTGKQIGIFVLDLYARDSKSGGAWMNNLVAQKGAGTDNFQNPIVCNTLNLGTPVAGKATLIDLDEQSTVFHEFGHFLHGMLSNTRYERFEGTNTPRDFVELPSQLNECFAMFPQIKKTYRHVETGEVIPEELLEKVKNASKFNQGYQTVSFAAAAFLDQLWHSLKPEEVPLPDKIEEFEERALKEIGLKTDLIPPRYRSTYFAHIFAGGYSACYASYLWSEVLDADCEKWFKDNGGMTRENGMRFRTMVLQKGGSEDCEEVVKGFLGREPNIEPLLERRGLN